MAEIGRSFDELDKKIKQVNGSLKETKSEVREVDKALKLDPTNVDLINKRFKSLADELNESTNKTELLKKKQKALAEAFDKGEINLTQYQRLLDKTTNEINKLTQRTDALNDELAQQNRVLAQARYDNIINGAQRASEKTEKLSRATMVFAGASALAFKYAVDHGSELDDLSHKYQTTAELLQIEGNLMERATGVADSYTATLKAIGAVMTSVAKGSTRYNIALKELGLTTADLKGKTNAEVYNLLVEKLKQMNDETERAIAAQTLLGDAGLNLALRAGLSAEEISKLNENLANQGIVSSEQAEKLAYYGDRIDDIKQSVISLVVDLVDGFTELSPFTQGLLITAAATLILLPKLIAGFGAVKGALSLITSGTIAQSIATKGLMASLTPIMPIILAISAAVLVLISIIGLLSRKAKKAAEDQKSMLEALQTGLPNMENNIDQSTTTTYESSSSKRIEIEANVTAEGDSEISEENAKAIGEGLYSAMAGDLDQMLGNALKE